MPFISFSCLIIALARASNAILDKSGKNRHLYLVPDLRGKTGSFNIKMLAVGFSSMAVILRQFPSILSLRGFIMKGC